MRAPLPNTLYAPRPHSPICTPTFLAHVIVPKYHHHLSLAYLALLVVVAVVRDEKCGYRSTRRRVPHRRCRISPTLFPVVSVSLPSLTTIIWSVTNTLSPVHHHRHHLHRQYQVDIQHHTNKPSISKKRSRWLVLGGGARDRDQVATRVPGSRDAVLRKKSIGPTILRPIRTRDVGGDMDIEVAFIGGASRSPAARERGANIAAAALVASQLPRSQRKPAIAVGRTYRTKRAEELSPRDAAREEPYIPGHE